MIDTANHNNRSRIVSAALFIFCAIPGLLLLLVFSTALFGHYYDPNFNAPNPVLSGGLAAVGAAMMLIGAGKWGKWRYILVFLSIPLSLFGYVLLDTHAAGGKLAPGVF